MPQARPRIVHVYKDVHPPVQGGIERTIELLAERTRERFDPAVIVAARGRGGRRTIAGGIEVVEVASLGRLLSTPLAPGFLTALRASRADLFHFHVPHPTGEVAFLMSRLRTPAVATYHSDVVRQRAAMAIYGPVFQRFLARMHTIMPTSQRYLESSEPLAAHHARCRVVPLGLPLEAYRETPEVARRVAELRAERGDFVLFLGCLRAYKGLFNLLMALKFTPRTRVVIAGEGVLGERLREAARTMGVADRVDFLGRVDQDEAVALLRAAAVFVLPSHQRSEAFGLVQVEAMACATPVIATNLPTGVPEVNVDGVTGLIVPPQEPQALAGAIDTLLADPARRRELGEAGRRRAELLYTADRMAADVEQVYSAALSPQPSQA